jgi:sigma-E factor negative regulatory protein RseB
VRKRLLGAVLSVVSSLALANGAGTDISGAGSDLTWLKSVQEAAQHHNFAGTIVYQRGADIRTSKVIHVFDGKLMHERILSLDGQPHEYVRDGDEVHRYFPGARRVVIEPDHARSFPDFAEPINADVLGLYQVFHEGIDRVAGVPCQSVSLRPRDQMRYGYRLCVESRSGLMLKAQTFDQTGSLIEQVAFANLQIDGGIDARQLQPSWDTNGWAVERHDAQLMQLDRQGWQISPPPGFHKLMQVLRKGVHGATEQHSYQAVYSDGLATVSVFIEPGVTLPVGSVQFLRNGAVSAVSRQLDTARITVIGEVPPETAERFAGAVSHPGHR